MINRYKVLTSRTSDALMESVNTAIKEGWEPVGHAIFNFCPIPEYKFEHFRNSDESFWHQTMVRRTKYPT